jgi:hypothetical protein
MVEPSTNSLTLSGYVDELGSLIDSELPLLRD